MHHHTIHKLILLHFTDPSHFLALLTPIHWATKSPCRKCFLPFPKPRITNPSETSELNYCPLLCKLFHKNDKIMEKKGGQQLSYILNHLCPQNTTYWLKKPSVLPRFQVDQHHSSPWSQCRSQPGRPQPTFTSSSTWDFQPNGKRNEGCTRANSSCPDRDAQGLFLTEL